MRKLYCLLLSATLILISLAPTYAQATTSELKSNIVQLLKREDFYMSDRVKTMCEEWPGCEEWAKEQFKKNPSFKILDAEVEYYVVKEAERYGLPDLTFWQYNFYAKTMEDLQEQSYMFKTKIYEFTKNSFPQAPQPIAKFPGHPFTDMPSNHARYELEERYGAHYAHYHSKKMRQRWPEISDKHWWQMGRGVEQQRVIWDKNGNPCWGRRFDYIISSGIYPVEDMKRYAVIARQNKLGEPFKYIDAKKANSILIRAQYIPDFCITIKYHPKEASTK